MDFQKYIDKAEKPAGFTPTGITKEYYLDIIEVCVKAYDKKILEKRLPEQGELVDDIHAYSRIACGIAALLSNGRLPDYKDLWIRMMDALCNDFHQRIAPNHLDFAVKETMLSLKAMKDHTPMAKQEEWLRLLGKIEHEKQFSCTVSNRGAWDHIANWNIYAMAGAWLLESEGHTDTNEFFLTYWDHQFSLFDENGMYMDPNCPILYDLTTRVQAQLITGYGYKGPFYDKLDTNLRKGALSALFYQSAAFELPYGGRSNQYLFNETLLTSNFEYEAARYKAEGDLKTAGMFKRAARLAAASISRWLEAEDGARHMKNFYPTETKFGVENYGYYDKYMMTMGVFLFIGYPFADETIEEFPCPAELGGYVFETTDNFHKIFANCGNYSVEADTSADFFYDATGFGRIHKKGVPTELALSAPSGILHDHRYKCHGCTTTDMALTPSWKTGEGEQSLAQISNRDIHSFRYISNNFETEEALETFKDSFCRGIEHETTVITESPDKVIFTVRYSGTGFNGVDGVTERYELDSDGVSYEASLLNPSEDGISFLVPAFITNGRDESVITVKENIMTVTAMGWQYKVSTNGKFNRTDEVLGNRNGRYLKITASSDSADIKMNFSLTEI